MNCRCERASERCMRASACASEMAPCPVPCAWQIRYMLAKFVFPKLGYPGWVGLSEHELKEKCEPFKYEVREHWKRLKRSSESMDSTLKPFVKTKWCDTAYFLAQVGEWCVRGALWRVVRVVARCVGAV